VLLSERSPEPNPNRRTRFLRFSGLLIPVPIRGQKRHSPERVFRSAPIPIKKQSAQIKQSCTDEPCVDPLYLFGCGLFWRTSSNSGAGWELVRCLKSSRQNAQIAAALLARAETIEQPVQAMDGRRKPTRQHEPVVRIPARRWS
jgi:hypothetical protein